MGAGAGGNEHWSRWALEQTGACGRMSNLICPKRWCHFFPVPLLPPVPLCFVIHLPQRLFASKPICPGANLPKCLLMCASAYFLQVPICIRFVLHFSQEPVCSDAHFYWCPLPLLLISPMPIFPKCHFGSM